MTLFKTSFLNAVSVIIKMLTSLVLNKVLAIYVGPSGYAAIGQFQNFIRMITTLASGAVNTGVIKYTAEYADDEVKQIAIWKNAGNIALVSSLFFGLAIALLHQQLSLWVLNDKAYATVFIWLGAGLVLFTLNALLLAILNGKKEINRYVSVNISGSLVSLVVTGYLVIEWGLYGALVALSINQSIIFLVTVVLCWRTSWFRLRYLVGKFDSSALKNLGKFTLMSLVSASSIPISQILIRNHIADSFSWDAAGHWDALMRISDLYLMVVTTPLAVYYLPRISEIKDNIELKREIFRGYAFILPITIISAGSIYLLRDWIIKILFTNKFALMSDLFAWQMAGDVVKISSWLLGYILVGKAMAKSFMITQVLFSISWVGLVWLMTERFGIQGVQIGYFINYILYWLVISIIIIRYFTRNRPISK